MSRAQRGKGEHDGGSFPCRRGSPATVRAWYFLSADDRTAERSDSLTVATVRMSRPADRDLLHFVAEVYPDSLTSRSAKREASF